VLKDRGAAPDAASQQRKGSASRFADALTRFSAVAAQPILIRRPRARHPEVRAAWAGDPRGITTNRAVTAPDVPLLDRHPAGHAPPLPLVAPQQRPYRRRRHYLLEGPGWTSLRLASDLLMSLAAVVIAASASAASTSDHPSLFAFPLVVVTMLQMRGMYRRRVNVAILDAVAPVIGAVSVAAMSVLAWQVFVHQDAGVGSSVGRAWALTLVMLGSGRVVLALVQRRARALRLVGKPTLIVGAGLVGAQVARRLEQHPEYGLRPLGFLDADPPAVQLDTGWQPPVLGGPEDLAQIAARTNTEHVIFAFSAAPDRGLIPLTRRCEELGLEISLVPRFFESINDRMALERLGGLPLLGLRAVDPKGWQFQIKYVLDRPLALLGLIVASPIMLFTALAVKLTSPGSVLFRQRRVGRDGKEFYLYKFRSMLVESDPGPFTPQAGFAPGGIEGPDRRTPIGRFLRRSALDELPQLVNVLKGEMSLVGPRPERTEFVEVFGRDHHRYSDRHRVKSGITGWAQVHGLRGKTSLADRVEWDNFYIENWSLWLDLKVVLLTLGAVVRSGDDA
jgi:exopolysaccharide biosynthesis polyprenyl glycosylphosphotransferase